MQAKYSIHGSYGIFSSQHGRIVVPKHLFTKILRWSGIFGWPVENQTKGLKLDGSCGPDTPEVERELFETPKFGKNLTQGEDLELETTSFFMVACKAKCPIFKAIVADFSGKVA